jgi:hypothetical protein
MRPRYASDSYASNKERRLCRIRRRTCSELACAYEHGNLSLRRFDQLSRLGLRQQRRMIAAEKLRSTAATIAAQAIEKVLDEAGAVRLPQISTAIREALGALVSGTAGRPPG